jgi:hypothetical protein
MRAPSISITKTVFHPLVERNPVRRGPRAAPIDPVPSIMAVTVARARESPLRELCVPRSADTAVVISAYGPFMNKPAIIMSTMFIVCEKLPYMRYKSIEGIAAYMKLAAVIARALSLSDIWPARIPPTMPPTSNRVERFPADFTDIYSPPISAVKKIELLPLQNRIILQRFPTTAKTWFEKFMCSQINIANYCKCSFPITISMHRLCLISFDLTRIS